MTAYTLKIVVLGDQYCGKTSMIRRFVSERFDPNYVQTRGGDLLTKEMCINDTRVCLRIFDTAGQETFQTVIKGLYRNAHGILLLFDISRKKTFDHIDGWISQINMTCESIPVIFLLGNKIDLHESKREITKKEGKEKGQEHGVEFLEVSVKKNLYIDDAFHSLVKQILDRRKAEELQSLQNGTVHIRKKETSRKCCF